MATRETTAREKGSLAIINEAAPASSPRTDLSPTTIGPVPPSPHPHQEPSTRDPDPPDARTAPHPPPIGGRLQLYAALQLCQWSRSTTDHWVLETVSEGYSLELQQIPRDLLLANSQVKGHCKAHQNEGGHSTSAIEPVPPFQRGQGIYSIFFLVAKKGSKMRAT